MGILRHYLYISGAKVDEYLPQFTKREMRRISGQLGVNIGVVSGSVSFEQLPPTDRIHRLNIVEERLRRTELVGLANGDAPWIEGSINATAAVFPSSLNGVDLGKEVMFFFASTPSSFIALAGSAHHVIGNIRPQTANTSLSHFHTLLGNLHQALTIFPNWFKMDDDELSHRLHTSFTPTRQGSDWVYVMIDVKNKFLALDKQPITFLARRLIRDETLDRTRYTLASPLYITADDP